jgi:hypothetical protein
MSLPQMYEGQATFKVVKAVELKNLGRILEEKKF